MRSRAVAFVVVCLVGVSCIKTIDEAHPTNKHVKKIRRCDDLRRNRDLLAVLAAGLSVVAGAGGLATIELEDKDSKRHLAYVALGVGFLAAASATYQNSLASAFADEGCPALYSVIREEIGTGSGSGTAAGSNSAPPAAGSGSS